MNRLISILLYLSAAAALVACDRITLPGNAGAGGPRSCEVIAPPSELGLSSMYTTYLNCSGITVLGTEGVHEEALLVAEETMEFMLHDNDDIRNQVLGNEYFYVLRGPGVNISDLAVGFRGFGDNMGGWVEPDQRAGTSRGDEILCNVDNGEFLTQNTFLHEFVHIMHFGGLPIPGSRDQEFRDTYEAARRAGLWSNTYAMSDYREYLAELTTIYYEVGRPAGPPEGNGSSNSIDTREEFRAYDPAGFAMVESLLKDPSFDVPGCLQRNTGKAWQDPEVSCPSSVTDVEGTEYDVVRIGNQCWMASNLQTARFADGTDIPEVTDETEWSMAGAAQCAYDNDAANVTSRGRLYNHAAADSASGICPSGFRIPTEAEAQTLVWMAQMEAREDQISSRFRAVGAWPNDPATDNYGFAARPTGLRMQEGVFEGEQNKWEIWLADEDSNDPTRAWSYGISEGFQFFQGGLKPKTLGLSIRCIQ